MSDKGGKKLAKVETQARKKDSKTKVLTDTAKTRGKVKEAIRKMGYVLP